MLLMSDLTANERDTAEDMFSKPPANSRESTSRNLASIVRWWWQVGGQMVVPYDQWGRP